MSSEVNQEGNTATSGGVIAGRDATVIHLASAQHSNSCFQDLLQKYRAERAANKTFNETIARLGYYKSYAPDEPRRDLKEKLTAGEREELIKTALRTKQQFWMKLMEFDLYESAQEIHAYLLAEVLTRFNHFVYPQIKAKKSTYEITILIDHHIIQPITTLLGSNDLKHYSDDVYGMIYFLTGNCFINWD